MNVSLMEHKTNEEVRQLAAVEGMGEKSKDVRLRCYGHLKRRKKEYYMITPACFLTVARKRKTGGKKVEKQCDSGIGVRGN